MNQEQWSVPSRSGGAGGSVRRARQRMEAGTSPETPQQPQQQRSYEQSRATPDTSRQARIPRPRPPMPPGLAGTRNGQGPIGVAISRPTQLPQWPLAVTVENIPDQKNNQQYQPPAGRGNPPQRPPRPSHVPSMLDASRLQEPIPTFQYKSTQQEQSQGRGQTRYQDDNDDYITSPMTQSSRPSTVSSVGTIPDFPVPMPPPPSTGPRRSANLGPPPSSRRGASSYYSQASYVSPIPEESVKSHPSHESYASSAAIPSSWGSGSPGYDYDDTYDERDRGFGNDVIEEGRESRESNDNDDARLIRSASLGKRAKPSMITTRSSEKVEPLRPAPHPQQKPHLETMGMVAGAPDVAVTTGAAMAAAKEINGQRETMWPMVANADSPLAGGTGFIDKSSSSSETEVPTLSKFVTADEGKSVPLPSKTSSEPRTKDMLGAYNAASSLQPAGLAPSRTPSPGFSRLSAVRRPPRLDIDAIRDAEARGSLTSLPDLIRRATRLASMMDRGKRPASRLALDDFPGENEFHRDKEMEPSPVGKRNSGLSGMLAAFPPPGLATPRDGTPRPVSSWPSPYVDDPSNTGAADRNRKRKGRRCCGLPCWGFLLMFLILIIIIAAAIIIPLELLVIHKPHSNATQISPLEECQKDVSTACQNGGSAFISSGNCACLCINGFTGSRCTVTGATGCTITTLSNEYPNVTLGDSIPRLMSAAQTNFSIPLLPTTILARFNTANLSCVSENALVTFDGLSQRVGSANDVVVSSSTSADNSASVVSPLRGRRDYVATSLTMSMPVPTGLVVDTTTRPVYSSPSTATPTTTNMPSASPSAAFIVTEQVLDFARVAVLFVLQQAQLDAAVSAQSSLQHFFSSQTSTNSEAANIDLGNANTANLIDFSINLGNGSVGSYNASLARRKVGARMARIWDVL